jgi:hypothetical protein
VCEHANTACDHPNTACEHAGPSGRQVARDARGDSINGSARVLGNGGGCLRAVAVYAFSPRFVVDDNVNGGVQVRFTSTPTSKLEKWRCF